MKINLGKFNISIEKIRKENNRNEFLPIFLMGLALFLLVSFGPQFIDFVKAATSGVTLTATVGSINDR